MHKELMLKSAKYRFLIDDFWSSEKFRSIRHSIALNRAIEQMPSGYRISFISEKAELQWCCEKNKWVEPGEGDFVCINKDPFIYKNFNRGEWILFRDKDQNLCGPYQVCFLDGNILQFVSNCKRIIKPGEMPSHEEIISAVDLSQTYVWKAGQIP